MKFHEIFQSPMSQSVTSTNPNPFGPAISERSLRSLKERLVVSLKRKFRSIKLRMKIIVSHHGLLQRAWVGGWIQSILAMTGDLILLEKMAKKSKSTDKVVELGSTEVQPVVNTDGKSDKYSDCFTLLIIIGSTRRKRVQEEKEEKG